MSFRTTINVEQMNGHACITIAQILKPTTKSGEGQYDWDVWQTCFKSLGEAQAWFHQWVYPDKWVAGTFYTENELRKSNPFGGLKVRLRTLIVQEVESR